MSENISFNSVREKLFNWLGQDLTGKTVLDLFSGSGGHGFARGVGEFGNGASALAGVAKFKTYWYCSFKWIG